MYVIRAQVGGRLKMRLWVLTKRLENSHRLQLDTCSITWRSNLMEQPANENVPQREARHFDILFSLNVLIFLRENH